MAFSIITAFRIAIAGNCLIKVKIILKSHRDKRSNLSNYKVLSDLYSEVCTDIDKIFSIKVTRAAVRIFLRHFDLNLSHCTA